MSFILGILIMIAGFFMVSKSESLLRNFGRIAFFEEHLGGGGSRLGYKLVGVIVMIIGFMIMTGMIKGFVFWILGPIIKHSRY